MTDLLEAAMIICFGISWPMNVIKAWKSRTAKGTSVLFYIFIFVGYLAGIACKILLVRQGRYQYNYVFFFYILNSLLVGSGIAIYFRNRRLDRKKQGN